MDNKLIALYPILFEARQYNVGDELPVNNTLMVEKWLSANTAEWRTVENETEFNKEYYENFIAEIKQKYNNEIYKLKAEIEDLQKTLDEYTNSKAIGDLDENELEEVKEKSSSQDKKKSTKTKK